MATRQKVSAPGALHRRLDVVLLARRDAAGGDEEVVRGGRRPSAPRDSVAPVRQDAEIRDRAAEAPERGEKHVPVGVVEPGRGQLLAGGHDLVAGREHRHPQRRADRDLPLPERRQERDVAGREPPPRLERDAAAAQVLAGEPAVGAGLEARREDDGAALQDDVLLHEDRVETRRHRRAGEDAHRPARVGRPRRSRGDAARHRQGRGRVRRRLAARTA